MDCETCKVNKITVGPSGAFLCRRKHIQCEACDIKLNGHCGTCLEEIKNGGIEVMDVEAPRPFIYDSEVESTPPRRSYGVQKNTSAGSGTSYNTSENMDCEVQEFSELQVNNQKSGASTSGRWENSDLSKRNKNRKNAYSRKRGRSATRSASLEKRCRDSSNEEYHDRRFDRDAQKYDRKAGIDNKFSEQRSIATNIPSVIPAPSNPLSGYNLFDKPPYTPPEFSPAESSFESDSDSSSANGKLLLDPYLRYTKGMSPAGINNALWGGTFNIMYKASFQIIIQPLTGTSVNIGKLLPHELDLIDEARYEDFWEYVQSIKKNPLKELVMVRFLPSTVEETGPYTVLLQYLNNACRLGVIKVKAPPIKDFYVYALKAGLILPHVLRPTMHVDFFEDMNRPDILIGILVLNIGQLSNKTQTPSSIMTPSHSRPNKLNTHKWK